MARFWVGTSGWNYKHWIGLFYPPDLPPSRWFALYSAHFSTVEINYTHYQEPKDKTYDNWREGAPDGFRFAVKAHRFLTHRKRLLDPEDPLSRVIKGARRLEDHLGPILYQLPPKFPRTEERAERLEAFLDLLPGDLMHVIEFRDRSWWGNDTIRQLRRHGVAFCAHDMGGADVPLVASASFAYVRFHGGEQKYAGNYPDELLERWAGRLREIGGEVESVWAYFNNDIGGHAIHNAKTLARLLEAPGGHPGLTGATGRVRTPVSRRRQRIASST
jgi:uncharacterized protein YecE (DUF72 family)